MSDIEEVKKARDIVQSLIKSRKILRIYPPNNPIYINTLEDQFRKFRDFFDYKDELSLAISQNEILYDSEQVYHNPEKEDNLALFFFKDGLRELTFIKALPVEELEGFLKVISLDFGREDTDEDVVTLFWERDFQYIRYVVDEVLLADEEDYEARALMELQEKEEEEDGLLKAYEDAVREGGATSDITVVPLSDKDLQSLVSDLERDDRDKTDKLIHILFEMFFLSESREDVEDLCGFLMNVIEYAVGRGDLHSAVEVLSETRILLEKANTAEEIAALLRRVIFFAGSEKVTGLLGQYLDGGQETDDGVCEEFVGFLDKNAIVPFMKILGELKNIHARKVAIDALISLGKKDIVALARGLNDPRWYVVRNIIYILRMIGDRRAVDYLLKTVKHGDVRVKKEVIRTLGELGGGGVLQALRDCLEDPEMQIRSASMRALGTIGSEAAKRILMTNAGDKSFRDRDFEEKKEYFEVLARWNDRETFDFFIEALRKKTFLGRAKNFENRACAAYGLGLLGNRDAIPVLNRFRSDNNRMLREFVYTAMKRLEHGQ